MKTNKKIFSLVLAIVMLLSAVPMSDLGIEASAVTTSQKNIAAWADYYYEIIWTAKKTVSGWKGNYTYSKGNSYRLPYGQPVTEGKYIGYGVNIDDFLSAANDIDSVFYTRQSSYSGNRSVYYATDCSGFVSLCWGLETRHTTASIPNCSTSLGSLSSSTVNKLQIGDCLNSTSDGHVILVTDVVYSGDTVKSIEITEQTPPQLKRTTYTASELVSKYKSKGYSIYRYSKTVPTPPSEEGYSEYAFNAKFEVKASSKTIRTEPYSTGTKVKTVSKGDTVTVKAYLYNKYGNLWYKTSSNDYIHSDNLLLKENDSMSPSNYIEAKFKVMNSSKPIRKEPISSSEKIGEVSKDATVSVIGYVYNEYGSLWYVCAGEGYISHDYLSVISSSSRTPSNYLNETLNVKAGKVLRSKPYGSSDEVSRIEKGTTLKVIGYVYNKWGNLWYYSSDKNYTYNSYLEQSSTSSKAPSNYVTRDFKLAEDKNARNEPYSVAEKNRSISKGTTISVIGRVTNLYGNTWYLTKDEDYLSDSNLTCVHVYTSKVTKNATCTATGVKTFTCKHCNNQYTETIAKIAHNSNTKIPAVAATCTKTGLTEGKKCSVCGTVTVAQQTVAKKAHSYTSSVTTAATCKSEGVRTYKCKNCAASYTEKIAKIAHNSNTKIPAVAATCTKTGLTEGKKCSVCGTVTVAQQTVAKKAHSEVAVKAVAATCTKTGLTEGKKCSVCGTVTVAQQTIPAKGHTEVIDKAVAATCTKTGFTEGKHCSVCGNVIVAQKTVEAVGHRDNNFDGKCDGCGKSSTTPDTPDIPDTPTKDCSCNCHKGGIAGFFFKILNFFQKLFGMNRICACGVKH